MFDREEGGIRTKVSKKCKLGKDPLPKWRNKMQKENCPNRSWERKKKTLCLS